MAPEDELCLLLARGWLAPGAEQRARELLAGALAWNRILERVRAHGILPLVGHNLDRLGFPGVPEPVQAALADLFRSNSLRNALLAKELGRLLALLGEARVPAMPLKGTALAESLYGDPALRVCADIDILVPPGYFTEAFQVILSSGHTAGFTPRPLVGLLGRYGKDCALMRQDRTCVYPLQLHCGLIWGGPVERHLLEKIWSDAARKTFRGVPAFALSADWEFLYLAVHAARHGLLSVKWFVDLDRLACRGMIDWEKVGQKARSLGWEDAVRFSLSACRSLFDTPVSPAFLSVAAPRAFCAQHPSDLKVPVDFLFSLRLLKTPSQKLRYVAIRLFVPTQADCRFLALPIALFFLYYPLRPLRLACETVGWLVQAGLKSLWRTLRARAVTPHQSAGV